MKIAPSILSADFARLGEEVAAVDSAGADWLHIDVMDGHFVPNMTIGAGVVKSIRSHSELVFDVHLMVAPVDAHIPAFVEAGADYVTVHAEAGPHLHRTLSLIRSLGAKAGVALNPGTPIEAIEWVIDNVDLVLIMSVNPGFGGQSFIPSAIERVSRVAELVGDRPIEIEVDGGVGPANSKVLAEAGATVLVAGSAVFRGNQAEYAANISAIRSGQNVRTVSDTVRTF